MTPTAPPAPQVVQQAPDHPTAVVAPEAACPSWCSKRQRHAHSHQADLWRLKTGTVPRGAQARLVQEDTPLDSDGSKARGQVHVWLDFDRIWLDAPTARSLATTLLAAADYIEGVSAAVVERPVRLPETRPASVQGPEPAAAAPTLLAQWLRAMRATGLSARTVAERRRVVLQAQLSSETDAHLLTTEQIEDFLTAVPNQSSRATYSSYLRAWFTWLLKREARHDNPMILMDRPREPRRRPRPISTEQLQVVLASRMHQRTRTMILLGAYAGLRVHEIAKIRGEDIDVRGATLTVKGKGGVVETLPLHPLLAAEAALYPSRGYWFPAVQALRRTPAAGTAPCLGTSVSRTVAEAMRRAGVNATAHQLRHWFGTELLRSGADARTVQTLMRHASLATTAIYTQVADESRLAGVLRLPQGQTDRDRA